MANTSSKFQCVQNVLYMSVRGCFPRRLSTIIIKYVLSGHVGIILQLVSEYMTLQWLLCVFKLFAIDSNLTKQNNESVAMRNFIH